MCITRNPWIQCINVINFITFITWITWFTENLKKYVLLTRWIFYSMESSDASASKKIYFLKIVNISSLYFYFIEFINTSSLSHDHHF